MGGAWFRPAMRSHHWAAPRTWPSCAHGPPNCTAMGMPKLAEARGNHHRRESCRRPWLLERRVARGVQVSRGRGRYCRRHHHVHLGRHLAHVGAELPAQPLGLQVRRSGHDHAHLHAGADARPVVGGSRPVVGLVEPGAFHVHHDALKAVYQARNCRAEVSPQPRLPPPPVGWRWPRCAPRSPASSSPGRTAAPARCAAAGCAPPSAPLKSGTGSRRLPGSLSSAPLRTSSISAASATVRVRMPTWSSDQLTGATP